MKKIIFLLIFITVSATSFAQPINKINVNAKTEYLKKSKHQANTACILLFGGMACWATCFFIFPKINWGPAGGEAPFFIVFGVGLLSIPASIPFFINSSIYKKKAMKLSIRNESVFQLRQYSMLKKSFPTLTLKISL